VSAALSRAAYPDRLISVVSGSIAAGFSVFEHSMDISP
jgi:hypothetical protein